MAHTKSTDPSSKLTREINRGYRSRRIKEVGFIVAGTRTNMTAPNHAVADVIASGIANNETTRKSIMIAPCSGKILRVYTNACVYPVSGGGTQTLNVKKAVVGAADVSALASVISIMQPAADETAFDGTLSTVANALDFEEGQLIYAEVALSNNAITTRSDALIVGIEWTPTER